MNTPSWLQPLANLVLGRSKHLRRNVSFISLSLLSYLVSIGVILHSVHLKLLDADMGWLLTGLSVASFTTFFLLVRSGWSQRFDDPVLTFPHAVVSILLCMAAYVLLGPHRANTMILIAQTIVLSMFRLKPAQVLALGVLTVALLLACVVALSWYDPVRYSPAANATHFIVAGSTLLTLSLIAKWVSDIRVRIGRQARELEEAVTTVKQMATNDMLTGVLNRRVMTDLAESELKLIERTGAPMCMALIDIDHFKQVNDQFGHHAGDVVLKGMAQHVQGQLRQVDKLSRWGGEEFLLMLPRVAEPEAMAALERLRQSVEAMQFDGHPKLKITLSAGVARALPGETLEHVMERADEALYAAKRQGRNRCLLASESLKPIAPAPADEKEALQ
ncbi:MAG: GGDEF domain-containing protein [Aquabacterium sp.]